MTQRSQKKVRAVTDGTAAGVVLFAAKAVSEKQNASSKERQRAA
ncbi:MAG: hypothetical protein ACLTSZ_03365 [Lachnospiraceae bacterium]